MHNYFELGSVIIGSRYAFIPPKVLKKCSKHVNDCLFHLNTVLGHWQANSNINSEYAHEETNLSGGEEQCTPGRDNVGSVQVTEYHDHGGDVDEDVTEEMPKMDLAEATLRVDKATITDHLGYLNCNR